jgi:hypothetical protein
VDPHRITFLGEDSKCDEMKFVAPKVVEKLKLWGSFSASLDPALITSVNMGMSAKMALQCGSFAPGFTPLRPSIELFSSNHPVPNGDLHCKWHPSEWIRIIKNGATHN